MTLDDPPVYRSGGLTISPALGRVTGATGESVRLGPVNMRVLDLLLGKAGGIVTRSEIFEGVWRNQVVSEDALTRCVSDIRVKLRQLTGRDDWIETLPKRGYRWTGQVRIGSSAAGDPAESRSGEAPAAPKLPHALNAIGKDLQRNWPRLAVRCLGYLIALIVMGSMIIWSVERLTYPHRPVIAVLPIVGAPVQPELAAELDLRLNAYLIQIDGIRVLARSAVDSRPTNPFPFFYYEFGALWVIESEFTEMTDHLLLTLSVVNSRTGIVEMQLSERIDLELHDADTRMGALFESLRGFIDAGYEFGR